MTRKVPDQLEEINPLRLKKAKHVCLAEYQRSEPCESTPTFLSEHSLIFLIKGAKRFYYQGEKISVKLDKVILLKRGYYLMCERDISDEDYESLALYCNEAFLEPIWKKYQALFSEKERSSVPDSSIPLIETHPSYLKLKEQLLTYFDYRGNHLEEHLRNKVEAFMLELADQKPQSVFFSFLQGIFSTKQQQISDVVSANLFNPLQVEDLAKLSGMSSSTFKRKFKELYNSPPKRWIRHKRLEHAKALLQSSEKTVAEIAFACGFEDPSHFIRLYKNQYGLTPKASLNLPSYTLD
ncbi:MAG: AraC family transcriptional regulator [Bacteroidia bacterium]|nr:AraC family transcriptional regulator [Bacteroidia bacterium]